MKESLGIYKHEWYLRCKGWLGGGELPCDTKLPILQANYICFSNLVIQNATKNKKYLLAKAN